MSMLPRRLWAIFLVALMVYATFPVVTAADSGGATDNDNIVFKDAVFLQELIGAGADKNGDGQISKAEAAAVTTIDITEKNITALDGIEYFTSLKELICVGNKIEMLDISKNAELEVFNCAFNKLTMLDVSKNTKLNVLNCSENRLNVLDVSKNTGLEFLSCIKIGLEELDVSNNTALTDLLCGTNKLTALDVSNNTELIFFDCSNNKLAELDVSNSTVLTYLYCGENQMTVIDVSKNAALVDFSCGNNQLTTLDISNNARLEYLWCFENNLRVLDVSSNSALMSLSCSGNLLTSLDVSNNTKLENLYCDFNYMAGESAITGFDKTRLKDYKLPPQKNPNDLPPAVKAEKKDESPVIVFKDSNFKQALVKEGVDTNGDGEISQMEAAAVKSLSVGGYNISSLDGIEYFKSIKTLSCDWNRLTTLDMSKNTALAELWCYGNRLTSLNVADNNALVSLYCDENQLTSLDLPENLKKLGCRGNKLTAIDATNNHWLDYLDCSNNRLTSIGISSNRGITYLNVSGNQLASIDLSDKPVLKSLYCINNQLTSLDVSGAILLKTLICNNNQIASLNISNKALTDIYCVNNRLTTLDVSNAPVLEVLYCDKNQLESLIISNKSLEDIRCVDNRLTSLDLSNAPRLTNLWCERNRLTTLDVSKNHAIKEIDCSDNRLVSINLAGTLVLKTLVCKGNQLTSLDVSRIPPFIINLDCSRNDMTSEADIIGLDRLTMMESLIFNHQNGYVAEISYTIMFNSNGGGDVPGQAVKSGEKAVAPQSPHKQGYTFGGWYEDQELMCPYDFKANAVFCDFMLYAKWNPVGSVPDNENLSELNGGTVSVSQSAAIDETRKALENAESSGLKNAVVTMRDVGGISANTMKAMAAEAASKPVKIRADSIDGGTVDVRVTVNPAKAVKGINLSASTTSQAAKITSASFAKYFDNNISVVSLSQQGDFGMPVVIAAKIGDTLDTNSLVFYSYNKVTNRYRRIPDVRYRKDKNGYVHFTTTLAGDIIITDKPLTKK